MERLAGQQEAMPKPSHPPNGVPHAMVCKDANCEVFEIARQFERLICRLEAIRTNGHPVGIPFWVHLQSGSALWSVIASYSLPPSQIGSTASFPTSVFAKAHDEAILARQGSHNEAQDTRSPTLSAQDQLTDEDNGDNEDGSEEEASNDDETESNKAGEIADEANTEHETDSNDDESGIEDSDDDEGNSVGIEIPPRPKATQSDSDATETAPSSWFEGAEEITSRDGSCSTEGGCKQEPLTLSANLLEQVLPKPQVTFSRMMASHVEIPRARRYVPQTDLAKETDHDGPEVESDCDEASDEQVNSDVERESEEASDEESDRETSSGSAKESVTESDENEASMDKAMSETSIKSERDSTKCSNVHEKAKEDSETDDDLWSTGSLRYGQDKTFSNDTNSSNSNSSGSSSSEESDGYSWAVSSETDIDQIPTKSHHGPRSKPAFLNSTPRNAFKRKVVAAAEVLCRAPKRQRQVDEGSKKKAIVDPRTLEFREKYKLKADKGRRRREARGARQARQT